MEANLFTFGTVHLREMRHTFTTEALFKCFSSGRLISGKGFSGGFLEGFLLYFYKT